MWHLNEGNKTGIEIKSKNNIAEKMQTSVHKVTEKFQNRYENKTMFNFEPKFQNYERI